jgi:hypothetical protein
MCGRGKKARLGFSIWFLLVPAPDFRPKDWFFLLSVLADFEFLSVLDSSGVSIQDWGFVAFTGGLLPTDFFVARDVPVVRALRPRVCPFPPSDLLGVAAFPWIIAEVVPFRASVPLSSFLPAVGKQRLYQKSN